MRIICRIVDSKLHMEILDQGAGFELGAVPDPTQANFIERPTGRGLWLLREYMDRFENVDGGHS